MFDAVCLVDDAREQCHAIVTHALRSMYTIQLATIPPPPQVPTPQAEGLFCDVTLLQ